MQPTLAVLHVQPPGWGGTVAARAHCGHVSVLSCPIGKPTLLFQVPLLPHDAFRLLSPPEPLGSGCLVLSTNALHFIQEGKVQVAASTNGFGPTTVATARHPLQVGRPSHPPTHPPTPTVSHSNRLFPPTHPPTHPPTYQNRNQNKPACSPQ